MKIWIRVGMEAEISAEDLKELKNGNKELMWNIIQHAELSRDTYVPDCDCNEDVYKYGEDYIAFEF